MPNMSRYSWEFCSAQSRLERPFAKVRHRVLCLLNGVDVGREAEEAFSHDGLEQFRHAAEVRVDGHG
jgi:hypothetical protein